MRRCGRCALVAGLLALLLGPLFLFFAKGSIDGSLRDQAQAALAAKGVTGVTAASDWAAITLTGPGSAKDAALAAVEGMGDRSAVDTVTYLSGDGGAGTGAPSPSASASATEPSPSASAAEPSPSESPSASATPGPAAPVSVDVTVVGDKTPKTIVLSGTVGSEAEHQALLDAATAAYGAGNVTDKITVGVGAAPAAQSDAAVTRLAAVITALGSASATGTANLKETALTVSATSKDAAGATAANAALDAAASAGLTVTGKVQAPAASAGLTAAQVGAQLSSLLAVRGVTFESDSSTLTPSGADTLTKVVAVLAKAATVKVLVTGHTDSQGPAAANQALSVRRAQTVKAFLVGHGIAASRISTAAYGETRPVATNSTPAGRLANRRIDLTVVGS